MSSADQYGSVVGGPLGIILAIARAPTFGKTSGYLVDTVDPATGIPYAGGIEPPAFVPDATFAAPSPTSPINIPSPGPQPGPFYPPTQRVGVPGPENFDQAMKRLKEEAERLKSYTRNKGKPPPKPPTPKGADPLGDYAVYARACISNPAICIAGGVLFPSQVADATLTKAEIKAVAKARKQNVFAKEPKIGNVKITAKRPQLILAGENPLAPQVKLKPVKVTAKRMPVETPKAVKITAKRLPMPSAIPSAPGFWSGLGTTLLGKVDVQGLLLGLAAPRPKSQPAATIPQTMTMADPLTALASPAVASPLAGGYFGFAPPAAGSLEDQCRNIRKRKKPKRRCIKRDDCNRCVEFEAI